MHSGLKSIAMLLPINYYCGFSQLRVNVCNIYLLTYENTEVINNYIHVIVTYVNNESEQCELTDLE